MFLPILFMKQYLFIFIHNCLKYYFVYYLPPYYADDTDNDVPEIENIDMGAMMPDNDSLEVLPIDIDFDCDSGFFSKKNEKFMKKMEKNKIEYTKKEGKKVGMGNKKLIKKNKAGKNTIDDFEDEEDDFIDDEKKKKSLKAKMHKLERLEMEKTKKEKINEEKRIEKSLQIIKAQNVKTEKKAKEFLEKEAKEKIKKEKNELAQVNKQKKQKKGKEQEDKTKNIEKDMGNIKFEQIQVVKNGKVPEGTENLEIGEVKELEKALKVDILVTSENKKDLEKLKSSPKSV